MRSLYLIHTLSARMRGDRDQKRLKPAIRDLSLNLSGNNVSQKPKKNKKLPSAKERELFAMEYAQLILDIFLDKKHHN